MIFGMLRDKKGKITINRKFLFEQDSSILSLVFSKFFPTHIENNFVTDELTYWGYSELFEVVKEGIVPPTYEIILTFKRDEEPTIIFNKL